MINRFYCVVICPGIFQLFSSCNEHWQICSVKKKDRLFSLACCRNSSLFSLLCICVCVRGCAYELLSFFNLSLEDNCEPLIVCFRDIFVPFYNASVFCFLIIIFDFCVPEFLSQFEDCSWKEMWEFWRVQSCVEESHLKGKRGAKYTCWIFCSWQLYS